MFIAEVLDQVYKAHKRDKPAHILLDLNLLRAVTLDRLMGELAEAKGKDAGDRVVIAAIGEHLEQRREAVREREARRMPPRTMKVG